MNIKIVIASGLFLLSFIGCSSSEMIQSSAVETGIVVDGNQDEWSGKLKFIENERAAVGFQNDDENLYICFVSADKAGVMKILSLGLTVWFQPENGEQMVGLQFPKRMDKVAPRSLMGKNREQNEKTDFEVTVKTMMQNQGEYSIVNEDEEILFASPLGSNDGYQIKIGVQNHQFVYEAKIPIGNNNLAQIPINVFPSEKIKIGFVSGEFDKDEMKNDEPMDSEISDGQGSHNGMGGGHGNGAGKQGLNRTGIKRLNFDVEVKLAE
ncbi:MAG: hypothetical protein KKE09_17695 [Bacteroidetes bacterium]|nr:hypothetical protein [Bacteroidota bacterium]